MTPLDECFTILALFRSYVKCFILYLLKNNLIISSGNEAFNPNKRKQIQDKILKTMKLIEPGMSNHNRYQEMFNNMNDKQFDTFMKDLKEGKIKLTLFAPNMKVFIRS